MRLYVTKNNRIRIGSGITVKGKYWIGNRIAIPPPDDPLYDAVLKKKSDLERLVSYLERLLGSTHDKSVIDRRYVTEAIGRFHKSEITGKKREKSIFDLMDRYLERQKISIQRKKNFLVLKRALMRFELYRRKTDYSRFTLKISAVSVDTLRQIEDFLAREKEVYDTFPDIYEKVPYSPGAHQGGAGLKSVPKVRGRNAIADMLTRLRTFFIWATSNGYTANNPFRSFSIGEIVYGTPIYISNEEREKLYRTDMSDNPALAVQRDIFVFQCLVGCRVSDLYKMTSRNIIDGCIEYIPGKTREDRLLTVRVPLNSTALEIIERYRDPHRESLLPFYSNQQYNVKIKEAFRRAGLDRMVTTVDQRTRGEVQRPLHEVASSHMARRSFIGNIYKQVKDPNLVGALSGHKEGSKAFARYRTIDDEIKKELVGYLDYDSRPRKAEALMDNAAGYNVYKIPAAGSYYTDITWCRGPYTIGPEKPVDRK